MLGHTAFVGQHLLGAQGDGDGFFRRQRPCLIEGVRVQRLGSAQHRSQRLEGGANNIIVRLLRRKRAARRLSMKAAEPGAWVRGAKSLAHDLRPDFARRPVFRHFLKQIAVGVEKETQARGEFIHRHARRA